MSLKAYRCERCEKDWDGCVCCEDCQFMPPDCICDEPELAADLPAVRARTIPLPSVDGL